MAELLFIRIRSGPSDPKGPWHENLPSDRLLLRPAKNVSTGPNSHPRGRAHTPATGGSAVEVSALPDNAYEWRWPCPPSPPSFPGDAPLPEWTMLPKPNSVQPHFLILPPPNWPQSERMKNNSFIVLSVRFK